jgi:chemotaxis protein histidine kinase CheA/ActR/RegA family two-component response regulator
MNNDLEINKNGAYRYFLEEAPELLKIIEQDLLTLCREPKKRRVHSVMRATHTLKSAASTVGLQTIVSVSHDLEDIVQCFYHPDLKVGVGLFSQLIDGFDRLRHLVTAKVTHTMLDEQKALQEANQLFEQVRNKLGYYYEHKDNFPISNRQEFDLVQAIFEVGVKKRLDQITEFLDSGERGESLVASLRSELEVLSGLAESLKLPGFGAIAQTSLTAIDLHPDKILIIARLTLEDLKQGHKQVLAGDRTRGGEPSLALQQLSQVEETFANSSDWLLDNFWEDVARSMSSETNKSLDDLSPSSTTADSIDNQWVLEKPNTNGTQSNLDAFETALLTQDTLEDSSASEQSNWDNITEELATMLEASPGENQSQTLEDIDSVLQSLILGEKSNEPQAIAKLESHLESNLENNLEIEASETPAFDPADESITSVAFSESPAIASTVRVKLDELKRLEKKAGEMQVQQNRHVSENERLQSLVTELLNSHKEHQQTIARLLGWIEKLSLASPQESRNKPVAAFSSQINPRDELKLLSQKAIAETADLQVAIESLSQTAKSSQQAEQKQQYLLSALQDDLMETRMVPISEVFDRFIETIRQLEIVHLKPINLKLSGAHVLVEAAIAEKLYVPLLHLVRNAFDHGIEPADVRSAQQKPPVGQIELRAYQQGWETIIEVKDDGQGLDFERIRDRAIALNLCATETAHLLSRQQLSDLLFEPGFSTASKISALSGRGIGLETVKAEVEALQGTCTVHSEPYKGTIFSLKFPLDLTVVGLTIVRAKGMLYAVLSDTIEKIIIPSADRVQVLGGKKVVSYKSDTGTTLVCAYSLSESLSYQSPITRCLQELNAQTPKATSNTSVLSLASDYLLVLRQGENLIGLEVEQILGEQKTIIKPLDRRMQLPKYIYGCSVLADNSLALVIDGALLVKQIQALAKPAMQPTLAYNFGELPALPSQPQLPSVALISQKPNAIATCPATILLVDDSIGQRQNTALMLRKAGYQVLQARNGLDAIEQMQMTNEKIRAIVCDVEMPHINGFEFLSYCRHKSEWAKLPTIVLSDRGGKQYRKIALGLGAAAYFTRPYIESDFLAALDRVLNR